MSDEVITIGYLNDRSGFFTRYNALYNTNFQNLFGELSTSQITDLDNLLSDVKGDKILIGKWVKLLNQTSANDTMDRIVKTANLICFDGWKAIKTSIDSALETDVTKPDVQIETIEQSTTSENGETTENKVYGYDSTTASDDSKNIVSGSGGGTLDSTKTIEKSNGELATENTKKVIDFARYNDFLIIILSDISEIMGLSVF